MRKPVAGALVGLVLVLLIAGGVYLWRSRNMPAGSSAGDEKQCEKAASDDVSRLKSKDFVGSYAALSEQDKASVSQDDWISRCREEQAVAGAIRSFKVLRSRYLDPQKTIVAVDVEVDFSKMQKPIKSALYYEMKNGKPVHTMLWNREITVAGDGQ